MVDYLKFCHGQLNRLLQAVLSDLSVSKYIAGCKALGIIDKVVTGPLWRHLVQSNTSILEMSDVYTRMEKKFEEWGQDAQGIIERQQHLFDEDHHENIVAGSLFAPTSEDSMVQEVLQLVEFTTLLHCKKKKVCTAHQIMCETVASIRTPALVCCAHLMMGVSCTL